jgi:hypothetical protein
LSGTNEPDRTALEALSEDDEDGPPEPRLADQDQPIRMLALLERNGQLVEEGSSPR